MARRRARSSYFSREVKITTWIKQGGKCKDCSVSKEPDKGQFDHIIPSSDGGTSSEDNCQFLCVLCHEAKTKAENIIRSARQRNRD